MYRFSAETTIRQQIFSCLHHVCAFDRSRLTVNIRKSIRSNKVIGLCISAIYMTMYLDMIWPLQLPSHPRSSSMEKMAFAVHIFMRVSHEL